MTRGEKAYRVHSERITDHVLWDDLPEDIQMTSVVRSILNAAVWNIDRD